MNEEYLVSAVHQTALITSLPFVHTARRSYRSNDQTKCSDVGLALSRLASAGAVLIVSFAEEQ